MWSYISESFATYFQNWIKMNPLFILCIVWFSIQFIKIVIDSIRKRGFAFENIFSAWWFPSFHTWIASSVTMMVWMEYWFNSVLFALSCGFALLVAYDAMNLRYESWKQAQCINEISSSIATVLTMQEKQNNMKHKKHNIYQLKERLWHTPIEVLWWIIISILITAPLYYFFIIK